MPASDERYVYSRFLFVVCLLAIAACDRGDDAIRIDCDIDRGPCVRELRDEGLLVSFAVTPRPVRVMSDLVFAVTLYEDARPVDDASVALRLSMPGMYMATNSPVMLHVGRGRYEGKGVIVKCASGRRIWKARLSIQRAAEGGGKVADVQYVFMVRE